MLTEKDFYDYFAEETISIGFVSTHKPEEPNQTKVVKNILYCLDHGTQMGWLIDPEEEIIFVYFSDRTIAIFESENALLPVPAFATNFQITLGQLFDWLRG